VKNDKEHYVKMKPTEDGNTQKRLPN
jgi:hypothetical protein